LLHEKMLLSQSYCRYRNAMGQKYFSSCFIKYSRYRSRNQCSDLLRAGRQRDRSLNPCRVKNFLFSTYPRPALRPTQPPIQRVSGALSPRVNRPGREADHSPPTSAKVKKT
jgi:hypothetical protein